MNQAIRKMCKNAKYLEVVKTIHKELVACELPDSIGLHAGTSGIALFLAYYDRIILQKNEISQRVMGILEYNINSIDSGFRQHTICNGISGFGWLSEHLKKMNILKRKEIAFLDDLDPYLHRMMIADIQKGNYDFLHGALGVATYFLSRFDKKEIPVYLEELLSELEKSGISGENGTVKWMSVLNAETGRKGFNICLSHGMSSIIAFLTRLYQFDLEPERVRKLLNQTVLYILDQMRYTDDNLSCFPATSKESSHGNYQSRLAWCYGDLGIAHVLWQAGIVVKNKDWVSTALLILHHTTNRRDLYTNRIRDAGLCHGSAGVAHVFWNLYLKTGLEEFRNSADYWLKITMQMAKYDDGLAGFKAWRRKEYGGPENSVSFLDGISGIGIVLLSQLGNVETAWDASLMLS